MSMPLDIFATLSKKFPDVEFFELYEKRDRICKKLPHLTKVRETEWTIAKHRKIDAKILKEKLLLLVDTLEEKKFDSPKRLEEIKFILENEDLRYYAQHQYFNFCYSDNFHDIYFFYYNEKIIADIKKYKRWTSDREYNISSILDAIIDKYHAKKRESEYYHRIKNYRKEKKKTFLLEIDFTGHYFLSDWTDTNKEKLYLIISDVNKDAVLTRLSDGNSANSIVKNFASKDCHQGYISNVSFLDFTDENLQLVKTCKEKRFRGNSSTYDRWNCFSDIVDTRRRMKKKFIESHYWDAQNFQWDIHRAFNTVANKTLLSSLHNKNYSITVAKTNTNKYFLINESMFDEYELITSINNKSKDYIYLFDNLDDALANTFKLLAEASKENISTLKEQYKDFSL